MQGGKAKCQPTVKLVFELEYQSWINDFAQTACDCKAPLAAAAFRPRSLPMKLRTRKFLGTLFTLVWIVTYALVMMAVGGVFVLGKGVAAELAFYIVGGLAWLPVEMAIIRWMSRPDLT